MSASPTQRVRKLLLAVRRRLRMHVGVMERHVPVVREPISVVVRGVRIDATNDPRTFVLRLLRQALDESIDFWKPPSRIRNERSCVVMKRRLLTEQHQPMSGGI